MTTGNVTRSRTQARTESQVIPTIPGDATYWKSRRKLLQASYLVLCPRCSEYRNHLSAGERVCPCGQRYNIVIAAVAGAPAQQVIS